MFTLAISCLTTANLPWFMGLTSQVLQYCSLLFFTTLDCTFTTRYIHYRVPFLLWPSHIILSGAITNCPLLFPSSILDTSRPGELIFWCHIFLPFHTVHGVLQARILEWVAISFSSGPHLSELFTVTCLGWPCMSWFIASLSYTSLFTTRLWSMKRTVLLFYSILKVIHAYGYI